MMNYAPENQHFLIAMRYHLRQLHQFRLGGDVHPIWFRVSSFTPSQPAFWRMHGVSFKIIGSWQRVLKQACQTKPSASTTNQLWSLNLSTWKLFPCKALIGFLSKLGGSPLCPTVACWTSITSSGLSSSISRTRSKSPASNDEFSQSQKHPKALEVGSIRVDDDGSVAGLVQN